MDPDGRETNSYWTDGSSALKNVLEKAEEITEENLPPKPSGNSIKRMGFWGALFYFCNNVLQSDSITPALPANYYRCGGNIYAPDGTVIATPSQAWAHSEGKDDWCDIDGWSKGSFDNDNDSLIYHFEKHGKEVGASSIISYLNKAKEFSRNLKRAQKKIIEGETLDVIRYYKNGKYIDIAIDSHREIISFGKAGENEDRY